MATNIMLKALRDIQDWLSLADYEKAKNRASLRIVSRLGRRNVTVQKGGLLTDSALKKLSAKGDKAVARLETRSAS